MLFFCMFSLTLHNSINSFIHIIRIPTTTTHSHSNSVIQSKSKLEQHTTRQTFQLPFHAFAFGVTPEKEHVPHLTSRRDHTHIHHSPHSPRLASLVHFLLPPTLLLMSEAFYFSLSRYTQPRVVASPNGFFIFSSLSFLFRLPPFLPVNLSLSLSLTFFRSQVRLSSIIINPNERKKKKKKKGGNSVH